MENISNPNRRRFFEINTKFASFYITSNNIWQMFFFFSKLTGALLRFDWETVVERFLFLHYSGKIQYPRN